MEDFALTELMGLIGNAYVRRGLSPPSQLHSAVRRWLGLTPDEIIEVLDRHFDEHRRRYLCGSGDGLFYLVEAEIRKAAETKHPPRAYADAEPASPPRKHAGPHNIYTIGGFADAIDDSGEDEDSEADA
jgi:hypothetical protein